MFRSAGPLSFSSHVHSDPDERGYSSRKAEGKPYGKFVHRNLASETPNTILTVEAPRGCFRFCLSFMAFNILESDPTPQSSRLKLNTFSPHTKLPLPDPGLVRGYFDLHIVLAQLRTSLLYMHASILPWFDFFRSVRNIISPPMLIRPWTKDSVSKGEPDLSWSLVQVH